MRLYKPLFLFIISSCINTLNTLCKFPVLLISVAYTISVKVNGFLEFLITSITLSLLLLLPEYGAGIGVSNRRLFFLITLDMSYHFPLVCIY